VSTQWLLFLHLAGAFAFVGGALVAATLRVAAMRRESASEVALLLRAVRPAVPLVAGGLVLAVGAGLALADRLGYDLGAAWLTTTFVLVAWMLVVGAVAGRQDRLTRELAERLGPDDAEGEHALRRRLRDPLNLALNATLLAATIAVVALMVWKPGA
jgi:uncharacterized membrane protein